MLTRIDLTDNELIHLDGKVRDEVQPLIDAAKMRLAGIASNEAIDPALMALVMDLRTIAEDRGMIDVRGTKVYLCRICGRKAAWSKKKGGQSIPLPGVSFLPINENVKHVNNPECCITCYSAHKAFLGNTLSDLRIQMPKEMLPEGIAPLYRSAACTCTKCNWKGYEHERIWDGNWANCPQCRALSPRRDWPVTHWLIVSEAEAGWLTRVQRR